MFLERTRQRFWLHTCFCFTLNAQKLNLFRKLNIQIFDHRWKIWILFCIENHWTLRQNIKKFMRYIILDLNVLIGNYFYIENLFISIIKFWNQSEFKTFETQKHWFTALKLSNSKSLSSCLSLNFQHIWFHLVWNFDD